MGPTLLAKFGNDKTGDDTLILNMGSATRCPGRTQCRVLRAGRACYPGRIEGLHPVVLAFRDGQERYWRAATKEALARDLLDKITRRPAPTRYLRFNESGDFRSQDCVEKLSFAAGRLKAAAGITTWGFTARADLDFSRAAFLVKGSGHDRGNNGRAVVVDASDPVPTGFVLCPENCRECGVCMEPSGVDIAFVER